jgi:hypothetical protein
LAFVETLISENDKNPIPYTYFNEISLQIGNIYFLNKFYEKALKYYENAKESSNVFVKGSAINNIASTLK